MEKQETKGNLVQKKRYCGIDLRQIEEAKGGLTAIEVEKKYTVKGAVYELRGEIGKLVKKGVKISQIVEGLNKYGIGASGKEVREIFPNTIPGKDGMTIELVYEED